MVLLLAKGSDIITYLREHHGLEGAAVLKLVKEATEKVDSSKLQRDRVRAGLDQMYTKAIAENDAATVAKVLDQMRKLDADEAPKPGRKRALSKAEEKALCDRFVEGSTREDLAAAYGIAVNTVANTLKRNGITKASRTNGAKRAGSNGSAKKHIARRRQLGDFPTGDSSFEQGAHLRRMAMAEANHIMMDEDYQGSERERRREYIALMKAASAFENDAEIAAALRLIERDNESLDYSGPDLKPVKKRKRRRKHLGTH